MKGRFYAAAMLSSLAGLLGCSREPLGVVTSRAIRVCDLHEVRSILNEHSLAEIEQSLQEPVLHVITGPKGSDCAAAVRLIVSSTDVDVNKMHRGVTALMHAAMWGRADVMIELLRAGADPELQTADGKRAVDLMGYFRDGTKRDRIVSLLKNEKQDD